MSKKRKLYNLKYKTNVSLAATRMRIPPLINCNKNRSIEGGKRFFIHRTQSTKKVPPHAGFTPPAKNSRVQFSGRP